MRGRLDSEILMAGELINIREFRDKDACEIQRYCRDPHVARYTLIPQPYKPEYAIQYIRQSRQAARKGLSLNLAIENPETGLVVGGIALMNISQTNLNAEVGFVLSRRFWGRGFVSEALQLMTHYGFRIMKLRRIYAHAMHPNIGSMQVLLKQGYAKEAVQRKALFHRRQWFDIHHFAILKEEFQSKRTKKPH